MRVQVPLLETKSESKDPAKPEQRNVNKVKVTQQGSLLLQKDELCVHSDPARIPHPTRRFQRSLSLTQEYCVFSPLTEDPISQSFLVAQFKRLVQRKGKECWSEKGTGLADPDLQIQTCIKPFPKQEFCRVWGGKGEGI